MLCIAEHLSVCPSTAYCEVHPPQGGGGQCSREQRPAEGARGPWGRGARAGAGGGALVQCRGPCGEPRQRWLYLGDHSCCVWGARLEKPREGGGIWVQEA